MSDTSSKTRKEESSPAAGPLVVNVNRVVRTAGAEEEEEEEEVVRGGPVDEADIEADDDDADVVVGGRDEVDHYHQHNQWARAVAPATAAPAAERPTELKSGKNKSQFYMEHEPEPTKDSAAFRSDYIFPGEEKLADLARVYCLNSLVYFSTADAQSKPSSSGKLPEPIDQEGRLELTNFCLRFMPSNQVSDCFKIDRDHQLFELGQAVGFVVPLMHILEVRGLSPASDKLKKLSLPSEVLVNVPRELFIKCKNFSTKYFVFTSSEKSISAFAQHLLSCSNSSQLRNNRFQTLLEKINYGGGGGPGFGKSRYSELKRPYLKSKDLRQDLDDCGCSGFMAVKSGALKIPVFSYHEFIINPNMTYYAVPKELDRVLMSSRVVVNESSVPDFASSSASQADNRQSVYPGSGAASGKKSNRLSEFLSSSKSATLSGKQSAQSASSSGSNPPPSTPVIANRSANNPFMENRFPIWSFTDIYTGCSLIVVPEAQPNRQDQCDIIVKNYNALLYDELLRQLRAKDASVKPEKLLNVKRVEDRDYGEYEFFKFKVPFGYEKIQNQYYKLMQLCSYKTSLELNKESETTSFYSSLHSTKWLKSVSIMISLATKIVACLHIHQRNVFVEEDRGNVDVSCVLVSLVRLLFDARCRTVAGFENLVHKEWFLAGHKFYDRLLTTQPLKDDGIGAENDDVDDAAASSSSSSSKDGKKTIAPVFLLFLDCVFQLTVQYPGEFEFNEYYLIHLWDYALSGMSYTFSFNGQNDWLNYVSRQSADAQTLPNLDRFDDKFLRGLFEANNQFWHQHLDKHQGLFLNKSFSTAQKTAALVLNPSDKIYTLRFWTRCYLRWYDIKHPYSTTSQPGREPPPVLNPAAMPVPAVVLDSIPTFEEDAAADEEESPEQTTASVRKFSSSSTGSDKPPPYKPPPPPPPSASAQAVESEDAVLRINVYPAETRITSTGDLQTNL